MKLLNRQSAMLSPLRARRTPNQQRSMLDGGDDSNIDSDPLSGGFDLPSDWRPAGEGADAFEGDDSADYDLDSESEDDELTDSEMSALDRFEREILSDADWELDDSPEPELGDFWFDSADEWD